MKMSKQLDPVENVQLKFHPRETDVISIEIPKDALAALNKVAAQREMPVHALLKFYIGQGLRRDLAQLFGDRVLEQTEQVLMRHTRSQEEVSSIIREIWAEAIG